MIPVDRMSELLGALRQQLTAKADTKPTSTQTAADSGSSPATSNRVLSLPALRKRMARELGRFNLDSDVERKEARKLFVESILSWDLGDQLSSDPRFSFLVREIEDTMVADASTRADLDLLIRSLQSDGAALAIRP